MITPMKKVTILTLASRKEETLKALREMEIIHLTPLQNAVGVSVNGAKGHVTPTLHIIMFCFFFP